MEQPLSSRRVSFVRTETTRVSTVNGYEEIDNILRNYTGGRVGCNKLLRVIARPVVRNNELRNVEFDQM